MVLSAIASGLPVSAQGILNSALSQVFGEGAVGVVNLNKDNLRQRVRLSRRNTADVLIVLDQVSKDVCKDIEDGLYNSDKFYAYQNDAGLVSFLNSKYKLSLEVPKEELEVASEEGNVGSVVDSSVIEKYESRIADKNLLIQNLQGRIQELENTINLGGYEEGVIELLESGKDAESVSELERENLSLRNEMADLKEELSLAKDTAEQLKLKNAGLVSSVESLKNEKERYEELDSQISEELTKYKVKCSTQSGLLKTRESEIANLKQKLDEAAGYKEKLSVCEIERESLSKQVSELSSLVSQCRVDLHSKDRDIEGLKNKLKEIDYSNEEAEKAEARIKEVESERDDLFKQIVDKGREYEELQGEYESVLNKLASCDVKISSLEEDIGELQSKADSQDNTILELNKQKIELSSQVEVLKKSTDRDSDIETLLAEMSVIKEKYAKMKSSVFSSLSTHALPQQASYVQLVKPRKYSNISFVFAGSTESRKGAYRCLLKKLRGSKDNVVIVDVVSETSIDYVFEVKKVTSGLMWFIKGGGIQSYLSSTCINNVKVLSPGLGYINDSYFLTVGWEKRLMELEDSGYKVILFCGDVSNLVGRVLHESFAGCGESYVYVHGNSIGSRTAVSNKFGISNFSKSKICYFEFNKQVQRFYDIVAKDCCCEIVD